MGSFHGGAKAKIEDNGRLSLPKVFFSEIDTRDQDFLYMTVERHKCILAYPRSVWEQRIARLTQDGYEDDDKVLRQVRSMERQLKRVKLDKQGRIYIPAELKERVGIDRDVELVGSVKRFEIWNPKELDKYEQQDLP